MFKWITDLFGGVSKTIETLDVSGNQKRKIRNELAQIQADLSEKYVELAKAELEARSAMVKAESASDKLIVYAWRPVTSLVFVGLIVADSFGLATVDPQLYSLATAFLGLTTAGRGLEKAAKANRLGK